MLRVQLPTQSLILMATLYHLGVCVVGFYPVMWLNCGPCGWHCRELPLQSTSSATTKLSSTMPTFCFVPATSSWGGSAQTGGQRVSNFWHHVGNTMNNRYRLLGFQLICVMTSRTSNLTQSALPLKAPPFCM